MKLDASQTYQIAKVVTAAERLLARFRALPLGCGAVALLPVALALTQLQALLAARWTLAYKVD